MEENFNFLKKLEQGFQMKTCPHTNLKTNASYQFFILYQFFIPLF